MPARIAKLVLIVFVFSMLFTSCSSYKGLENNLKVHYIDVGQGDSILIQTGGKTMLIDTGLKQADQQLLGYLNAQGIKYIDYLILTHEHNDHIGNAAKVIKTFRIGTIYMPPVKSDEKEFESMTKAVKKAGLHITNPASGSTFDFGEAKCSILAPNSEKYDDPNNYSIVLRMVYKNTSFLFAGDAQVLSENEMINKGYDLSSDVLKVGQHGSNTATSEEFLNKVNPKYAVVSCGLNNSNNHPGKETMQRLKARDIKVFRTDESGTIVCTSDGSKISFDKDPSNYKHGKKGK